MDGEVAEKEARRPISGFRAQSTPAPTFDWLSKSRAKIGKDLQGQYSHEGKDYHYPVKRVMIGRRSCSCKIAPETILPSLYFRLPLYGIRPTS